MNPSTLTPQQLHLHLFILLPVTSTHDADMLTGHSRVLKYLLQDRLVGSQPGLVGEASRHLLMPRIISSNSWECRRDATLEQGRLVGLLLQSNDDCCLNCRTISDHLFKKRKGSSFWDVVLRYEFPRNWNVCMD
jgi:hypothetical protein